jgi:hypothetical protein
MLAAFKARLHGIEQETPIRYPPLAAYDRRGMLISES